tara:strand:- start:3 stop:584 length:582 start_codon:yes stop_codon:yes gene_type:complete
MTDVDYSVRTQSSSADNLFVHRWSPRAFKKFLIEDESIKKIFDAARWSPSCSNEQPWRFYTAKCSSSIFPNFVSFLSEGNQTWAKTASLIGFLTAKRFFERKEMINNLSDFDCGAAWMSLTLQASLEGLHTHGMGGINREKVSEYLKLDIDKEKVLMGFVIGKLAESEVIEVSLRSREKPSDRKDLISLWKEF